MVTLRTRAPDGGTVTTRLWVVDHAGSEWVRTGHPGKGWFTHVVEDPRVDLERAGSRSARLAVPVREGPVVGEVNGAFTSKYGVADAIVALSGDASLRVPVRLDPEPP